MFLIFFIIRISSHDALFQTQQLIILGAKSVVPLVDQHMLLRSMPLEHFAN